MKLRVHPATPERWKDLARLFGPNGAYDGCWCMYPRLSSAEYQARRGKGTRSALYRLVKRGSVPGLLGYDGDEPVGWVALAPREAYRRVQRSRVTKPVDDLPVWAITCFVVRRSHRGRGVAKRLLRAAVAHAREQGAPAVEAFPVEPRSDRAPANLLWPGTPSMYAAAGFREIARRTPTRPLMRKRL